MSAAPVVKSQSSLTLFRMMVVSLVLARCLKGEPRSEVIAAVAAEKHMTPAGEVRQISPRTLYRWMADYERDGLVGLEPVARARTESSVVLPAAFVDFLRTEKTADPRASIPELIRRAREQGVLKPGHAVDRVSAWRACHRMELPTRRRPHKREADTRRFAYPHRMMMVIADGKRFRAGTTRARRVALVFLDDATRYAIDGIVGTSESAQLFLLGLHGALSEGGYFDVLYVDHGDGFIALDTQAVIANLPHSHLVHGVVGYPEGRGMIEVFNRTLYANLLRGFDKAAEVDPDCKALTVRLRHYLKRQYNFLPHEGLGGDTPQQRWESDPRALRLPADDRELRQRFVIREDRTVSADHIIRHGGLFYEAPRGLARSRVEVHRNVLDGQLFVAHQGRMIRLQPVDMAANATDPRHRSAVADQGPSADDEATPRTAAMMAFERELGPLVGPDGGFSFADDRDDPTDF